ncbi:MAG: KR domain-containing protein, partial [bacterium]|nr:KR domain-containing protein [bacterium]
DFFILCSSISVVTAPLGQAAYCAANAFMDHFAYYRTLKRREFTVSINWDDWREVGMAAEAVRKLSPPRDGSGYGDTSGLLANDPLKDAISPREGIEIFRRVLGGNGWPQVVVSTTDLQLRLERDRRPGNKDPNREAGARETGGSTPKHARPELSTEYAAPGTGIEKRLAPIWENLLGIGQVGIYDDFFELGGDSLKAVNFSTHIHKELNTEVPISEFFNRPNIKELAQYIEENSGTSQFYAIQPVEKKEYYPLSPAQRRLYILNRLEEANVAYNLSGVGVLRLEPGIERMEKALWKLLQKHESLRTSFHIIYG